VTGRKLHLDGRRTIVTPQSTPLVVGVALRRIAQDLIGSLDLAKALRSMGVPADVGMILACQRAIGPLDLRECRSRVEAQDGIVVGFEAEIGHGVHAFLGGQWRAITRAVALSWPPA
jgi:hypothetical protein